MTLTLLFSLQKGNPQVPEDNQICHMVEDTGTTLHRAQLGKSLIGPVSKYELILPLRGALFLIRWLLLGREGGVIYLREKENTSCQGAQRLVLYSLARAQLSLC